MRTSSDLDQPAAFFIEDTPQGTFVECGKCRGGFVDKSKPDVAANLDRAEGVADRVRSEAGEVMRLRWPRDKVDLLQLWVLGFVFSIRCYREPYWGKRRLGKGRWSLDFGHFALIFEKYWIDW